MLNLTFRPVYLDAELTKLPLAPPELMGSVDSSSGLILAYFDLRFFLISSSSRWIASLLNTSIFAGGAAEPLVENAFTGMGLMSL